MPLQYIFHFTLLARNTVQRKSKLTWKVRRDRWQTVTRVSTSDFVNKCESPDLWGPLFMYQFIFNFYDMSCLRFFLNFNIFFYSSTSQIFSFPPFLYTNFSFPIIPSPIFPLPTFPLLTFPLLTFPLPTFSFCFLPSLFYNCFYFVRAIKWYFYYVFWKLLSF